MSTTDTVVEVEMTRTCARDLIDRIKAGRDELDGMLHRAYHGKAWASLKYESWKAYIKAEFQMSEQHSFRMLDFVKITNVIKDSPIGESVAPRTESQARPLTKLPPEQQPVAWEKAVEKAGGEQPTAKQVQEAVVEVLEPEERPVPRVVIDAAERIWTVAKSHLDKITAEDASREKVLKHVAEYALARLQKGNSVRKHKEASPEGRIVAILWQHIEATVGIEKAKKLRTPKNTQALETQARDFLVAWSTAAVITKEGEGKQ